MTNKLNVTIGIILLLFGIFIWMGCSKTTTQSSISDYQIKGKVSSLGTASVKPFSSKTVTHIVAIGTDNQKYLADLSSDGTFSVGIKKGCPYVLGFYNKTTLLGYLIKDALDWDSLPLIDPSSDTTDLGTVSLNTTTGKAEPSVDITSLISEMKMVNTLTAQYYGKIDDPLTVFTNIDIDGNGVFDFQENRIYMFAIEAEISDSVGTANLSEMLNGQYNEDYLPLPSSYIFKMWSSVEPIPSAGTTGTFKLPQSVTSIYGTGGTSDTFSGTVSLPAGGWTFFPSCNVISPTIAPSGSYTIEVSGKGTYNFNNVQGTDVVKVGSNEGLIYPVFNIVTDADGYITRVNYKWKKINSGSIEDATATEVKNTILDSTVGTLSYTDPSPVIAFSFNDSSKGMTPIKINRDQGYIDITTVDIIGGSSQKVKLSDIYRLTSDCTLSSFVICRFYY